MKKYNKKESIRKNKRTVVKNGQSREPVQERDDMIFGRNAVIEALEAGHKIEKIFISNSGTGSIIKIEGMARDMDIPIFKVPKNKIESMAPNKTHQGVVAIISPYSYSNPEDIFALARSKNENPFILILDGITDPNNFGAIIRSASCAGCHGIIIPKRRSVGINSTVVKVAAGAIERVPIVRVTNLAGAIEDLKSKGLWVYAADMKGTPYYETTFDGGVGLIIGSEGSGISQNIMRKSDFAVSIPIIGSMDSLNASAAATVLMYEIRKQRILNPKG